MVKYAFYTYGMTAVDLRQTRNTGLYRGCYYVRLSVLMKIGKKKNTRFRYSFKFVYFDNIVNRNVIIFFFIYII